MKKLLLILLALTMCISMCACSSSSNSNTNTDTNQQSSKDTAPSVESLYEQLVQYATDGKYLDAWRLGKQNPNVLKHKDAQSYADYCEAMRAYEAGGLGEAYKALKAVPNILEAQSTINKIEARIGKLNGHYVENNGMGAFLHLVIRDGFAATKVIGYTAEEQQFLYTDKDFMNSIVLSKYDDGTEYLAIGRYSSIGAEITIDYVMNIFEDSDEIMLVCPEGASFDTMNGLYKKTAEVESK